MEDDSHHKFAVRRSSRGAAGASEGSTFGVGGSGVKATRGSASENPSLAGNIWTACPYCYNLYEYPRVYEGCCLRCDNENCKRSFTATSILSMPPMVPGSEAYYCCWGFFPMGFAGGSYKKANEFPKWMLPLFGEREAAAAPDVQAATTPAPPQRPPPPSQPPQNAPSVAAAAAGAAPTARKRGRPRKNV